jgi:hypothetical protein
MKASPRNLLTPNTTRHRRVQFERGHREPLSAGFTIRLPRFVNCLTENSS